ncbi:DUF4190 domain-containing protein [Actinoplanes sp. RD1]|uniref:DUF4190 domain-containing protein n=1 Tax=Actinoplanes sp. RD1 TaxID=3064538 RepID=UPI002741575A|nr:DUF4190 domain-containing protein [Actinoplanes sp. RD1]
MPPQPKPGTNGFAIAALIFGIVGGLLFAVIFGAVALSQIKKSGQKGRGLAIGGMAAAGAWVLIAVLAGIIGALADTSDDDASAFSPLPAATSTVAGSTDVQDLVKGDCLKTVTGSTDRVYDLPKVACSLPHEGEVFATYTLPAGAFPGDAEVEDLAFEGCDSRYSAYTSEDDPAIEIYYLHPLRDTWSSDRGVTCIAVDTSGPRTGSLRD